jgi:hypothetical protein
MNTSFRSLRFWLRVKRCFDFSGLFEKKETVSEKQETCCRIVRKLISSPESELVIAPISGDYYIKHRDLVVKMTQNQVHIINGKYFYSFEMPQRIDKLEKAFRVRLEGKVKNMESEMVKKTQRSLHTILDELENEKVDI